MLVELAYGSGVLAVDLPDDRTTIVAPSYRPPQPDEFAAVEAALRHPIAGPPLRAILKPGQTVAISVCDGTRPQPRQIVVPALLAALADIVRLEDIVVLVATGSHRGNSSNELREMLGTEVIDSVRVVNHDARDDGSLAWIGRIGANVPVFLNRDWIEADVRITSGFVEPHFFAGFSGGPKMVAPGLAGLETIMTIHDAKRIGHPRATWGVTEGNPVHDDIRAIAAATGTNFSVDVILNREKRIVRAFAGELFAMHRKACAAARRISMCRVRQRFDVVLTSNSGYPLDQNLYQTVKGMAAAAQIVKPNGTIVCASECRDGFPDHGSYRSELTEAKSPRTLLRSISGRAETVPDQWSIQIQAGIQCRSRVIMHTSFLSDEALAAAHLEQTNDIGSTVREALRAAGPESRLCVLPEGPQTIPYVD